MILQMKTLVNSKSIQNKNDDETMKRILQIKSLVTKL